MAPLRCFRLVRAVGGVRRYILADRFEEITDPEHMRVDPACDRTIYLYGYNRGTYMRAGQRIHIPGVGDFHMDDVSVLDDPCPLPSRDKDKQKRRTLKVRARRQTPRARTCALRYRACRARLTDGCWVVAGAGGREDHLRAHVGRVGHPL